MEISVACDRVSLDPQLVSRVEDAIYAGEGSRLSVGLVVVGHDEIRQVNRDALGHDWETDVVAFDLRDADLDEAGPDGEIYVNAEMAAQEAAVRGASAQSELLFYVAHGLLHLLGYDDATPDERSSMHELQRRYLESAGVVPPAS